MIKILFFLRDLLIFATQLSGALFIAEGLRMIYPPASVIYCGVAMIWLGRTVYAAAELEESDK